MISLFRVIHRILLRPTASPFINRLTKEFDTVAPRWISLYKRNPSDSHRWAIFQGYAQARAIHRMQRVLSLLTGQTDLRNVRVLDVGCGGGDYAACIHNHGGSWIGLDFSLVMLQYAKNLLSPVTAAPRLLQANASHIPLQSRSVDCVLCIGVMSYYPRERIAELTAELNRVLRPGGLLITQSIALDPITWLRSRLPQLCPNPIRVPGPLYPHHPHTIRSVLQRTGFTNQHTAILRKLKLLPAAWIYLAIKNDTTSPTHP